jgi:hypothetical protein
LGILSKASFRVNFFLSSPSATPDSASNFVNTAITGTEANLIISQWVEDATSQRTAAGVALGKKLFLGHRNRPVILIHWDAIPVREDITMR